MPKIAEEFADEKQPFSGVVDCEVRDTLLTGEDGDEVSGLCVKYGRCDKTVQVFGTSERSMRRAFVMLREECPKKESNYYREFGSQ